MGTADQYCLIDDLSRDLRPGERLQAVRLDGKLKDPHVVALVDAEGQTVGYLARDYGGQASTAQWMDLGYEVAVAAAEPPTWGYSVFGDRQTVLVARILPDSRAAATTRPEDNRHSDDSGRQ